MNPSSADRLAKAREKNDKAAEKRYVEFMRHLGAHPAKKEAEGAKYKKKFFGTVFRSKRKGKPGFDYHARYHYYTIILNDHLS